MMVDMEKDYGVGPDGEIERDEWLFEEHPYEIGSLEREKHLIFWHLGMM